MDGAQQVPTIERTKHPSERRFDGGVPKRKIADQSAQTHKMNPEEAKIIGSIPPSYPPQNPEYQKSPSISFTNGISTPLNSQIEQSEQLPISTPNQLTGTPSYSTPLIAQTMPSTSADSKTPELSVLGSPMNNIAQNNQQVPNINQTPAPLESQNVPSGAQQTPPQNDFFASYQKNNSFKMPPEQEEPKRGFFRNRKKSKKENKAE